MLRKQRQGGALLASVVLLGGCSWLSPALTTAADTGPAATVFANRDGTLADPLSYTIRRIRGAEAMEEPLQVEPGNVWPAEEAPRATLANPDAALRGVPAYRPGGDGRDSEGRQRDPGFAPPRDSGPRADAFPPADPRPLELRRRRDSSSPPPVAQQEPDRLQVFPEPPRGNAAPPRLSDGQVVLTPGGPVVTSGGTGRIQGFTTPGGGGGTIQRDGGFTTITPSGGLPQTFPTPR